MATFHCGDRLRFGTFEPGASGCLVRFPDFPDRVLMLTAGHVVLPTFAQQGDAISAEADDEIIGRLFTWTAIEGDPTSDAALVWVDPRVISASPRGLPPPTGINTKPAEGDRIRIAPKDGELSPREARIKAVDQDVDVLVIGPGWPNSPKVTYRSQIVADRLFSEGGDSGAVVLDDRDRVVGMVVAGGPESGTVITPIASILGNPAWGGRRLELVREIGDGAVAPPGPTVVPEPETAQGLDISWLDAGKAAVAAAVCERLAAGGLGLVQQAAALGNAVAESSLNPKARRLTDKEDSVGLFQLNRKGGAGSGRSVEELESIDVQCAVVLDAVRRLPEFMEATTLEKAVDVFVRKFERPANAGAEVPKRLVHARRFLGV